VKKKARERVAGVFLLLERFFLRFFVPLPCHRFSSRVFYVVNDQGMVGRSDAERDSGEEGKAVFNEAVGGEG
jgi:hypothetical protein